MRRSAGLDFAVAPSGNMLLLVTVVSYKAIQNLLGGLITGLFSSLILLTNCYEGEAYFQAERLAESILAEQ